MEILSRRQNFFLLKRHLTLKSGTEEGYLEIKAILFMLLALQVTVPVSKTPLEASSKHPSATDSSQPSGKDFTAGEGSKREERGPSGALQNPEKQETPSRSSSQVKEGAQQSNRPMPASQPIPVPSRGGEGTFSPSPCSQSSQTFAFSLKSKLAGFLGADVRKGILQKAQFSEAASGPAAS